MAIEVDFSDVKELGSYTCPPAGTYACKVVKATEGQTTKGTAKIDISFEIVEGEFAGCRIYDGFFFTEKAYPRLKTVFNVLGLNAGGKITISEEKLLGKTCMIETEVDEYVDSKGQDRQKAKATYNGYKAWAPEPLKPGELPKAKDNTGDFSEDFEEDDDCGEVPF